MTKKTWLWGLGALFLALLPVAPAQALNCASYTYTLTNGQVADANQVMANFNTILNCANNNLAHNGANSDITSLSGLTTPLSVAQGGTGAATLTANNVILGNGTTAVQFVAPGATSGEVLTSNGTTWASTLAPNMSGANIRTSTIQTTSIVGYSTGLTAGTSLVQNPYVANTTATQAHGLGAVPQIYVVVLECLTGEGNYSAGDKIQLSSAGQFVSGAAAWNVYADTTNTYLNTASGITVPLLNKTTHAVFSITAANWKLTITPYKIN
jgi:hypothetical protein